MRTPLPYNFGLVAMKTDDITIGAFMNFSTSSLAVIFCIVTENLTGELQEQSISLHLM